MAQKFDSEISRKDFALQIVHESIMFDKLQEEEVRNLKNQIKQRDKRIRELNKIIKELKKKRCENCQNCKHKQ